MNMVEVCGRQPVLYGAQYSKYIPTVLITTVSIQLVSCECTAMRVLTRRLYVCSSLF